MFFHIDSIKGQLNGFFPLDRQFNAFSQLTSFTENDIKRVGTVFIDDRTTVCSKVFTVILFDA